MTNLICQEFNSANKLPFYRISVRVVLPWDGYVPAEFRCKSFFGERGLTRTWYAR